MKKIVIKIIEIYQKIISPDHSAWGKLRFPNGYCQYYPTCSEYAKQSIDRKGVVKGGLLSVWRVIRCNPLSSGGIDEVASVQPKYNTKNS